MSTCSLCGKKIGLLDSTTYYIDASGNQREVHTECLRKTQSTSALQSEGPTVYAVEQEGTTAVIEEPKKTVNVGKLVAIGGAVVVGLLIVGALFGRE